MRCSKQWNRLRKLLPLQLHKVGIHEFQNHGNPAVLGILAFGSHVERTPLIAECWHSLGGLLTRIDKKHVYIMYILGERESKTRSKSGETKNA